MSRWMLNIRTNAISPPTTGEMTQLAAICPIFAHLTASTPIPAMPKPTKAPTIECVVETGQPFNEATNSQMAAASKAAIMPNISISGWFAIGEGSPPTAASPE